MILWWPWSGCGALRAADSRFLGARKWIGATGHCWKNMWCLEWDWHLAVSTTSTEWNTTEQSRLSSWTQSGLQTSYSAPFMEEMCGWISINCTEWHLSLWMCVNANVRILYVFGNFQQMLRAFWQWLWCIFSPKALFLLHRSGTDSSRLWEAGWSWAGDWIWSAAMISEMWWRTHWPSGAE